MGEEHRKAPRVVSLNLVSVARIDGTGVPTLDAMGRTLNISEGGIKFEAFTSIPLTTEVEMGIALGEDIIHPRGRVVYLEELEKGRFVMGLRFFDLAPQELDLIKGYLARKKQ